MVVFALHEEVAPIGPDSAAVNAGAARRQRASADELVKSDPELRFVSERECFLAYSGLAAGVHVRMKHMLAGGLGMEVPVLIMIGPRRHPVDKRQLLVIATGGSARQIAASPP